MAEEQSAMAPRGGYWNGEIGASVPSSTDRIVAEAMRVSRDNALDAAIELCEEFARTGHSAECCVKALRDFKAMLPAPPSSAN